MYSMSRSLWVAAMITVRSSLVFELSFRLNKHCKNATSTVYIGG